MFCRFCCTAVAKVLWMNTLSCHRRKLRHRRRNTLITWRWRWCADPRTSSWRQICRRWHQNGVNRSVWHPWRWPWCRCLQVTPWTSTNDAAVFNARLIRHIQCHTAWRPNNCIIFWIQTIFATYIRFFWCLATESCIYSGNNYFADGFALKTIK